MLQFLLLGKGSSNHWLAVAFCAKKLLQFGRGLTNCLHPKGLSGQSQQLSRVFFFCKTIDNPAPNHQKAPEPSPAQTIRPPPPRLNVFCLQGRQTVGLDHDQTDGPAELGPHRCAARLLAASAAERPLQVPQALRAGNPPRVQRALQPASQPAFPGCQNSKMRFPPARSSSTLQGRNRHGHPPDRRDAANDPRVNGIHVQDPPSASRHNAPRALAPQDCSAIHPHLARARHARRDHDPLPSPLLPPSSPHDPPHLSIGSIRRRRRRRESIPPDRESRFLPLPRDHDYETARPAAYLPVQDLDRRRRPPRSPSPSIRKTRRTPSPFADESRSERPRQDPSLWRPNREPHHTAPFAAYGPRPDRSSPPPPQDVFLTRRDHHRHREAKGRRAYTPPLPDPGRSPSPRRDFNFAQNPNLVPLGPGPSSRHHLDRSPVLALPSLSRSHRQASPYIDINISRRQSPDSTFEEHGGARPPRQESFRDDFQDLFPSHTPRPRGRRRSQVELPDLASGANSIRVNMSARGNFRGSHGGRHYSQGAHDARNYTQSSSHATPNSSVHGSPPAQPSSHSSGRGSWNGQK